MAAFVPGRRAHFCPRAVLAARRLGPTGPPDPHRDPMSHPRRALARLALVAVLTAAALASSAGAAWADPVLATAGDIACKTPPGTSGSTCHYGETADLIPATPSAKAASTVASPAATDVLVLGDAQYGCGARATASRGAPPPRSPGAATA